MLWGYAHAAGYKTALFNGQTVKWSNNVISGKEYGHIDRFVPILDGIETDRPCFQTIPINTF